MNTAFFSGRFAGPAIRKVLSPSGAVVVEFDLMVYDGTDGKGNERVLGISCEDWRSGSNGRSAPQETTLKLVQKGNYATVSGRISSKAWIDKTTGVARSRLHLNVTNIEFQGLPLSALKAAEAKAEAAPDVAEVEDDIPFSF